MGIRPRFARTSTAGVAAALALAVILLGGCGEERAPVGQGWTDARLYFGLSNDQGEISAADFTAFSDAVITPLFPDGLTVFHADGQWREPDGSVTREKSAMVEVIYHDSADARAHIGTIIDQYKRRFRQQSVLLVVTHPEVEFR